MLRKIVLPILVILLIPVFIVGPTLAQTPPQAAFIYYPIMPMVNDVMTFDASASKPGDPNVTLVNFGWNFSDGSPEVNTPNNVTTHSFGTPNNYNVTLNVTDSRGLWSTASKIVTVYALNLSVATSKARYERSDTAYVSGTFTWIPGSIPVMEGLVGVEIRAPSGSAFLFRTRPTSLIGQQEWPVNFTKFYPSDRNQVPKYSFKKGEEVWIFAEWKNFDVLAHPVTTCISLFDSNYAPIGPPDTTSGGVLGPGLTVQRFFKATAISDLNILGGVTLYGSLFSDLPMNGGYAYSPEWTASFTITLSILVSQSATSKPAVELSSDGTYDFSFRFPFAGASIGNYTVYASSQYYFTQVKGNVSFTLFVMGDVNGDGIVDIYDAILLSNAYNSTPDKPNWNPRADFNNDNIVDIYDAIILASHYG